MSSASFNMRLTLARILMLPQPSPDLLERLERLRKFVVTEFKCGNSIAESSPDSDDLETDPLLNRTSINQDSNLEDCKDFQLIMNISQFRAKEIEVKVANGFILVHGKHDKLSDGHGCVTREFIRRCKIPVEIESSTVRCIKNKYGVLVITASKKTVPPAVVEDKEIHIPVEIEKPVYTDIS